MKPEELYMKFLHADCRTTRNIAKKSVAITISTLINELKNLPIDCSQRITELIEIRERVDRVF